MTVETDDTKQRTMLLIESVNESDAPVRKCGNPFGRSHNGEGGIDYIAVIGCFLVQFLVLGIMNNVGILKTYWEEEYKVTPTHASLPGSFNYGFMFATGLFSSAIEKRIGFANMHCIGCLICCLSLFFASCAPSFRYVIASYGVLLGIGASFAFFSTVYAQLYYFPKKLPITNGIISAGSGCGTMTLSIVLKYSCGKIGWRYTLYIFSAIMLASVFLSLLYRTADFRSGRRSFLGLIFAPTTSQKKVKTSGNPCTSCLMGIVNFSPLKNPAFVIFMCSCFIFMLGYMVPFLYIRDYALSVGIDDSYASKMVGCMSISSLFGKIAFGNFAMIPKVRAVFVFQVCLFMIGVTSVFSRFCTSLWHFLVYSIGFGFFEGGYVSLTSVVVVDILGTEKGPSGIGLLFALKAIPIIVAAPLTGILHQKFDSFRILIVSSGTSAVLASSLLSFILCVKSSVEEIEIREDSDEFNEKKPELYDESLEVALNKDKQVL